MQFKLSKIMKKILTAISAMLIAFSAAAQSEGAFILHKVAPKETLYSLVKRYNTNFATVETLNPTLANGNSDIKVGQTIKFPKNTAVSTPTKSSTVHVVKANETVFSISKLYNVDISNLVEANKITDNTIKIGQKLIVDGATLVDLASKAPGDEELRLKPVGKSIKETGIAEVIKTPNKSTKYLALHRTAPIGTNIKVTNDATGHTIVAKVIGNLNEKGPDENIMIKLSPYAYYQLRPKDSRLRATVEFYLPNNDVVSQ